MNEEGSVGISYTFRPITQRNWRHKWGHT